MTIWALSDPHLSFGTPNKSMEVFGPKWYGYTEKIKENWISIVADEDLVLIPGDISWGIDVNQALPDLTWIAALPGTKLLLKGNHDYWWPSASKLKAILPPSMYFIQNNAFHWNGVSFAGSRLWDTEEYSFASISSSFIDGQDLAQKDHELILTNEKIFQRELQRLELSLAALDQNARLRVALTHYPPIGLDLKPSLASLLLAKYHVDICVFGHLHGIRESEKDLFGQAGSTRFVLASADYLDFHPIKIV